LKIHLCILTIKEKCGVLLNVNLLVTRLFLQEMMEKYSSGTLRIAS
jgi:hypothetical protein